MTDTKEKRHRIEERIDIPEDYKYIIPAKSDDRCAWCGKKVFLGYGGTIDHYIPLKKGGTNELVNLVLMCKECNQKKGSKVVPVNIGASYLLDKYIDELGDYFEDYIKKYDYVSRGNLICCDMYEMFFLPQCVDNAKYRAKKKGKDLKLEFKRSKYILKRAYPDDAERITEYFIKYLKKYKMLNSEEAASNNIKFWMRFGSIYYIEKNNEVCAMTCVMVNRNGYISFDEFVYYSNDLAITMSTGMIKCLGEAIMEENGLTYLPISINKIKNDELSNRGLKIEDARIYLDQFVCRIGFLYSDDYTDIRSNYAKDDNEEAAQILDNFKNFISRFKDIEDDIQMYLYENDLMDYSWMADEILGRNFFNDAYYIKVEQK